MTERASILCLLGLLVACSVRGDDAVSPTLKTALSESRDKDTLLDREQERRHNTATIGVLILVGIAAIGLLLVAAALIWGAKVRRMVRKDEPQATQRDDLWYVRKGIVNDSSDDASADRAAAPSTDLGPRTTDTDDTRS